MAGSARIRAIERLVNVMHESNFQTRPDEDEQPQFICLDQFLKKCGVETGGQAKMLIHINFSVLSQVIFVAKFFLKSGLNSDLRIRRPMRYHRAIVEVKVSREIFRVVNYRSRFLKLSPQEQHQLLPFNDLLSQLKIE